MKKMLTLILMLGFLIGHSVSLKAQLITADGTVEAAWDAAEYRSIENVLEGADNISSENDFSAKYKILWDAQGIYLLIEVLDDTLTTTEAQYFKNDMAEVYFDMDNSKNILKPGAPWNVTAYDENDYQFSLTIGDDAVSGGPDGADVSFGSDLTTAGKYILEFHFDWSDLGLTEALTESAVIGFDITLGDNDNSTSRDSYLGWNTTSGEAYHDPSLFGVLELVSGNLTSVPEGVTIDGKPDPVWYDVPEYKINKVLQGGPEIAADDLSGSFKTYYDENGFYIWAVVKDDTLTTEAHPKYFNNDMMEIYFDLDNSKNPLPEGSWWNVSSYDDNDYQFNYVFSQDTVYGKTKIPHIAHVVDTGNFYAVEMMFPWDSLGLDAPLVQGDTIGFDIFIGDNDSTSARQRMLSWHSIDGEAYHDASRFGTLVLAEGGKTLVPEGIVIDGKKDPLWAEMEKRPINTVVSGEESIRDGLDFSGYHQLYWDENSIYLLVQVNDDTLTTTEDLAYWKVDNIEVYLDMDNSKNPCPGCPWNESSYDENDFQYQLRIGGELMNGYAEYSQNIFEGGYLVEYKFPFDSMNIEKDFAVNDLIGFDIYITDNDNNNTRDAQLSWFDDSGEAYHIASKFGTIELAENGKTIPSNECEIIPPTTPVNLAYENLTSSFIISWDASEDNVAVYGYEVYRVDGDDTILIGSVFDPQMEIFDFESEGNYNFLVRAYDECNNYSLYSDEVAVVAPKVLKYNVVKSDSEITLDGKPDEAIWENAVWDTASIYKIDASNDAEETIPEEQDLHTVFAMTWDEDYLYAFADISDAAVTNWDGSSNDWDTRNVPFQFDCIEFCIGGSNERYVSDAGLKPGDTQWRFNTGVSDVITGNPGNADLNSYSVEFAEGISLRNAGGYTFEIKFPWDAVFRDIDIPADLGVGTELLFTMITIDNDGRKDGDMFLRDHEVAYFDGTGNHWKQTNGYKTMTLGGLSSIKESKYNNSQLRVYPNPASENLIIRINAPVEYLDIYNGLGQLVKRINNVNKRELNVSISEFDKGVYFIKSVDTDGMTSISKFIKL